MVIGIDCDEVLVPTISYHCKFLNNKYDINLSPKQFTDYDFWHHYNATRDQAIKDFMEFSKSNLFKGMKPFPYALAALQVLKNYDSLEVVSSRQAELTIPTTNFVVINFPNCFSRINIGNNFANSGKTKSKLEICIERGINLIIEDDPKHIVEIAEHIPVIMFDKPWNQQVQETQNIIRAYNWQDILEKTLKRLNYIA